MLSDRKQKENMDKFSRIRHCDWLSSSEGVVEKLHMPHALTQPVQKGT